MLDFCLQVLSLEQAAQSGVHAFPHVIDTLDVLATIRSTPSKQALEAAAQSNLVRAEWTQFLAYYEMVQALISPEYGGGVPMSACPPAQES